MIPPYTYTVDSAVLEVFNVCSRRQREKLLRIFEQLADNPFLSGELVQKDSVGRPLQIHRFAEWLITYWSEHASRQVFIIAVEHLSA